ncbi:ABC transporter ATP-binding protein [Gordonia mangrovi]|nr:ABC transporter ATP-binding protein [Gordonia mangrovi]UVF79367.1 ABC transporter ATP-binding protein [Gordonia mangrovi]
MNLISKERETLAQKRDSGAPSVNLEGVSVAFDVPGKGSMLAVDNIDLEVPAGQFVALVGPSGCGKTTALNMLAGLMTPSAGTVSRYGKPVTGPSRDIGYMLARSALTPWRTVRKNVELGLEIRGIPAKERKERSMNLLEILKIDHFADAFPSQMSHGMQQRVAIARTLAIDPDLWLMDEPFGALDAQTRVRVQTDFMRIWEGSGKTVLFVTHDLSEAVMMADRVIVMTQRPAKIKLDMMVDVERPRNPQEQLFDPRLEEIERTLWEELRHEFN